MGTLSKCLVSSCGFLTLQPYLALWIPSLWTPQAIQCLFEGLDSAPMDHSNFVFAADLPLPKTEVHLLLVYSDLDMPLLQTRMSCHWSVAIAQVQAMCLPSPYLPPCPSRQHMSAWQVGHQQR